MLAHMKAIGFVVVVASTAMVHADVASGLASKAIDRQAVVSRHRLVTTAASGSSLDLADVFSLGNGGFAFNFEATGLQTFNQTFANNGPKTDLNILSDWGWHSLPGVWNSTMADSRAPLTQFNFTTYHTPIDGNGGTRPVTLATDGNLTNIYREWTMSNPHRVGLGQLGLRLVKPNSRMGADPSPLPPSWVTDFNSTLDIWNGAFSSSFVVATASGTNPFCGTVSENGNLDMECADGSAVISAITFASFGNPTNNGSCPGFGINATCNAANTTTIVEAACLGNNGCSVPAINGLFGDPCRWTTKHLSVMANCSVGGGYQADSTSTGPPTSGPNSTFAILTATVVHPDVDMVTTRVTCNRQSGTDGCPLALRMAFSYSTGGWGPSPFDWTPGFENRHTSIVTANTSTRLTIARTLDDALYTVDCSWTDPTWNAVQTATHAFSLLPPSGAANASVELSCLFAPEGGRYPIGMQSSQYVQNKSAATLALLNSPSPLPALDEVAAAASAMWNGFWLNGAFVDLASNSNNNSQAVELERRVILSRYLTRVHSTGASPPQETGLYANSWSGRFHLEMRWWHQAHWSLWGNPELLDRTNAFYFDLLPNATSLARFQGYDGARWSKMLGLANTGNASTAIDVPWLGTDYAPMPSFINSSSPGLLLLWESANGINPVLTWNQPHMIWLADVQRRAVNASQGPAAALVTVQRLSELVFATAEFCAAYPFFNDSSNRYEFGPPTLGAEEFGDFTKINRPVFETVYFSYVLDIANDWKALLGLDPNPLWATVASSLGQGLPLDPAQSQPTHSFNALAACCYIDASSCPNGRFGGMDQCSPQDGHPSPAAVLGMVNGRMHGDRYGVDAETANNTIAVITSGWGWNAGGAWGWDQPLVAMGQIRQGWDPHAVVDMLLMETPVNQYWRNGFNFMGQFVYLPGNGGTLAAVAMMAGGTTTSPVNNFPTEWGAVSEGFFQYP